MLLYDLFESYEKPLLMYHTTSKDFDKFLPGSHFGTKRAARHRFNDKGKPSGGRTIPVYLDMKNPLHVTDREASDEAELLNAIARGKYPDIDLYIARKEGAYAAAKQAGYDGLVYENNIEDIGELSYVIFNPSQVKSAIVKENRKTIITAYHGTNKKIDKFKLPTKSEKKAIFFTNDLIEVKEWGHDIYEAKIDITDFIEVDYESINDPIGEWKTHNQSNLYCPDSMKLVLDLGKNHAGVIIENIQNFEGGALTKTYAVFDPNVILSFKLKPYT